MKNPNRHLFTRPYIIVISAGVGLCLLILIMVWARAFYGAMRDYQQGDAYLKKAQYIKAITFFDRSMHWYTPFNPYVHRSAERLWEIGMHAEQQGNTRLALIATRTIRRSFYAARSFYTPGTDWIKKCNLKIEEITGIRQADMKMSGHSDGPNKLRPENQEATAPNALWSVIVEIGFLGWVGSTIGFIIFACKENRQAMFFIPRAIAWGAVTLIFFVVWLVGMMKT